MRKIVFVTGTGTGVGKTYIAERLLGLLARQGLAVAGMKPVETGLSAPRPEPSDAERLRRASTLQLTPEMVCLYRLGWPASPHAAAQREGVRLDVEAIREAVAHLTRYADVVVVEGVGGLMVPLTADYRMIDLAQDLRAGVVLVATTSLGTINHTMLSCEALHDREMDFAAVILNRLDPDVDPELERSNVVYLSEHVGVPCWGPVPHDVTTMTFEQTVDGKRLLGRTG